MTNERVVLLGRLVAGQFGSDRVLRTSLNVRGVRRCRRRVRENGRRAPNGNPSTRACCFVSGRVRLRASSKASCRLPAEIDTSYQVLINQFGARDSKYI